MKNYRTGNYNFLRQQNLIGIMHYLYDNAPISRVELSRLTLLNKTTVSSLIEELLENGFVREVGVEKTNGVGRNSVLLDINPNHGYMISSEIGGNFIHVICTNFSAKIIWQHKEPIKNGNWQESCDHLVKLLRKAVEFAEQHGNLLGIALGVHGLFNKETGNLIVAPNSGWQNVPLLTLLQQNFSTDIFIDNEANLAALGEQFFGAAEGFNEVLYISAGRGIGGGLVLNGQIYNGASGIAGEFGHMVVNPEGLLCSCGNRGCWETEVNHAALVRHLKNESQNSKSRSMTEMLIDEQNITVESVVTAACNGDESTIKSLKIVGQQLGNGFASLINILNPGLIVFGGELSSASEFLLPAAKIEIEKRSRKWASTEIEIVVARFGSEAAIMGGIGIIFQSVLSNLSGLKRKDLSVSSSSS